MTTTRAATKRVRYSADVNMTFLAALLRRFPEWAIWLPKQGQWTAVRVRPGLRPSPEATLIWVQASSASKLYAELKRAERKLRAQATARAGELTPTGGPP
jgi:hypothetical protein